VRIGFFSESYYPYISGVVRSIDLFSRELRSLGHEVYIFAPDYYDSKEEKFVYRFPSVPTPNAPGFRLPIPYMPKLTGTIENLDLDIIHTHSPFLMGRLASALAKKLELPLVFTYHTKYEQYVHYVPFARKTARRVTIKLTRDFCQRCDAVIAPTEYVKKMLEREGITTPIEIIPTGVELDKFRDGSTNWLRRRYRFQKEDEILLYVGRLGEEKNLPFLLEVVRDLMKKNPRLYLLLVGGGPDEKQFRRMVNDWDLEHRIIFTGVVSPRKVVDYYLGADVFVFPSVTETQGLVILEAMAAGLPVVAMNREGPSTVIDSGKDGILVQPNKTSFKQGLLQILENPQYRDELRANAGEKARSLSSVEMGLRLEKLYRGLLASQDAQKETNRSQS